MLCGSISTGYKPQRPDVGIYYYQLLTMRRSRMEGFLVTDYADRFAEARRDLLTWAEEGRLHQQYDVLDGLEQAPLRAEPPVPRRQPRQAARQAVAAGRLGGRIPQLFGEAARIWPPHRRVADGGHSLRSGAVIVDAHVHLHPDRLAAKVRAFMQQPRPDGTARLPMAYGIEPDDVLAAMAGEGVERVWSFSYAHKPGIAVGLNEASAALAAATQDGPLPVMGGGTVHPGDDDPGAIVTDAVDRLGLGVLKLHCSVGAFDVDDRRLDPVFAVAAERRLPVVIHLGHAVDGRTEVGELAALDRVATAHPDAPLILAHSGHEAARGGARRASTPTRACTPT